MASEPLQKRHLSVSTGGLKTNEENKESVYKVKSSRHIRCVDWIGIRLKERRQKFPLRLIGGFPESPYGLRDNKVFV